MSEAVVSRRVVYHGRVQGVGFRFTAHRIARGHPVGGWVRNLPDRTVELVVAGSEEVVRDYLEAVAAAMSAHITRADETPGPDDAALHRFEIRQ